MWVHRSRSYLTFSHVSSLSLSQRTLQSIIDETASGDNKGVGTIAKAALDSANKAQSGVDSILKDIVGGEKPERSECVSQSPFSTSTAILTSPCSTSQTIVAQGIVAIQQSVGKLEAAAVKPSKKLAKDIKKVKKAVEVLTKGGEGVLGASGLNLGDVGLTPPPAGSGTASSAPSASSTKDTKAPAVTGVPDKKEPAKDDKADKQAPAKDDKADKKVLAKDAKADKQAPAKDEKDDNRVPAKGDKADKQVPAKDNKADEKAPVKDDKKPPAKDDKADKKAPAVGKNGLPLSLPDLSLVELGN